MSFFFFLYLQPRTCQKKGRHSPTQLSCPVFPRLQQVMQYLCIYPNAFSLARLKLVLSLYKVQMALKHILSQDAEFLQLIEKVDYSEIRKKIRRTSKLRMRAIQ